jgi:ubiquinone/menaquinone biosynthesis C-methylase UbiE
MSFSALVCAGFAYLFVITRGSLIAHALVPQAQDRCHIYWVYSNSGLTRLSDRKPCVAAILLFQYDRLVDRIIEELKKTNISGKRVLMTSCAFGDVMPRVMKASHEGRAGYMGFTDIMKNQLVHADKKLRTFSGLFELVEADATCMPQMNETVDVNLIFFLLHELPDASKESALYEAIRLVAPGGKLIIAEFHRPKSKIFRMLGRIYFTIFEPYALTVWDKYDPLRFFEKIEGWTLERSTYFFGNFQVVVATKKQ